MNINSYDMNKRLPFMAFNWSEHGSRTARLTREERGLFDEIRTELWSVVGVKMHRTDLMLRLRIDEGGTDEKLLNRLIALGLIRADDQGMLYDEVQAFEFDKALAIAEQNRLNGKKGGRPKAAPTASPQQHTKEAENKTDF